MLFYHNFEAISFFIFLNGQFELILFVDIR